jgi:hypothetical protein
LRSRFPTKLAVLSAAGGAVFGYRIANALATRTSGTGATSTDVADIPLHDLDGVELDGLLGEFELRTLLDILTDVEIEEILEDADAGRTHHGDVTP